MINPDLYCKKGENWIASSDPSGGSPGRQNASYQNISDITPPDLVSVFPLNNQQVLLIFDKRSYLQGLSSFYIQI